MTWLKNLIVLLLCFASVSGSELPAVDEAALAEYHIDRLGLTVMLPEEAWVTGRRVSSDYPPLELFGMTASQLEVQLKKGNIYCEAIWLPEETDMTEIVISMTQDDDSKAIFQLRDYDRLYLDALADSYAAFEQQGQQVSAMYTDAAVVETDQAVFIKANGVRAARDVAENHLHYMTVVNGMRIEITLVEHYSVDGKSTQVFRVSPANEELMDRIIQSLRFDGLKNEFLAKNSGFVAGACVVLAACTALIIAYVVSKIMARRTVVKQAVCAQEENSAALEECAGSPDESEADDN